MKYTFNTIDIRAVVKELKAKIIGLRVNQVYDVDHKTYLFKLQQPDLKIILLVESGARLHTTEYEWPKHPAPSSFTMKLRKHLRNKRIESIEQLGVDRVVDLTFGSGEAAYHLIIEMYDRGNIALTDYQYLILNVLRPRRDTEVTKIIVNEVYPVGSARQPRDILGMEDLKTLISEAKDGTPLKKVLNPLIDCGGSALEHELICSGFPSGAKIGKDVKIDQDIERIHKALINSQSIIDEVDASAVDSKGYIIKKKEDKVTAHGKFEEIYLYQEFHHKIFAQHKHLQYDEFESFNAACDEFFSKLESIQLDKKTLAKEKEALKKLENVLKDHEQRLKGLEEAQEGNKKRGQLIELNETLVKNAIAIVRSAIANQLDWNHIQELIEGAQTRGDPTALAIRKLELSKNKMTLWLSDPYDCDEDDMLLDSDEEREEGMESESMRPMAVDIDLDMSSLANARNYYNKKRQSAKKQQKTIESSHIAIKSAEKKTQQTLKEVNSIATINKARKVHWFEKFCWFISSENFLVIAGRDSQRNELVVKRHLRQTDIYVHADLHGASSVVVKNPSGAAVPPVTLHEAGIMALCFSKAWDEKVVTSAWWVWGNQVSKTAPTGEYLTTGAFMVRGKKNFLPPSHLVYGFGFLFRLEESSVLRHRDERKSRQSDETTGAAVSFRENSADTDEEIPINDDEILDDIKEEDVETEAKHDSSTAEESLVDTAETEDLEKTAEGQNQIEFPDTELEIHHLKEGQFTLTPLQPGEKENISKKAQPVLAKSQSNTSLSRSKNKSESDEKNVKSEDKKSDQNGPLKRGQKGKLKKMKKYKDQDSEEKELRMKVLQSAGVHKPLKGKAAKKVLDAEKQVAAAAKKERKQKENPTPVVQPTDVGTEDADDPAQTVDDLNIIDSLTGIPVIEDEILYAVPVCAPYNVMNNYKYKVKLTPGLGKKGKACKTALNLFLSDKSAPVRDKDVLRAVKEYDLAKNLPGKVRISAPKISKFKKK